MVQKKLRIGKIAYANVFPIFYMLERVCDCSQFEIVEGVPSALNAMLRAGEIDISPSSSVEYLKFPERYTCIDGISISSRGPVGSVFLFSKKPLAQLAGARVAVTPQSATSVVLLDVLLRGEGIRGVEYVSTAGDALTAADAFMLIGDDALIYHLRSHQPGERFVYDLGDLWFQRYQVPFVFALWIVRKELISDPEGQALLKCFSDDLAVARQQALIRLGEIAPASPLAERLSIGELLSYWNNLDYALGDDHKNGLSLFRELAGLPAQER